MSDKINSDERNSYLGDLLNMEDYNLFSFENVLDAFPDDEYIKIEIQKKIDCIHEERNKCRLCGHQKRDGQCINPDCFDDGLPF